MQEDDVSTATISGTLHVCISISHDDSIPGLGVQALHLSVLGLML